MSAQIDGGYYESLETLSPDRVNSKSVTRVPGNDIGGLFPTFPGQIVTVIEDGGGYLRNTAIMRDSDDATWIGLSGGKHRHDDDTDPAGGRFDDIMRSNVARYVLFNGTTLTVEDFARFGGGSAANEPSQARIRFGTTGTQYGYVHASRSGGWINYGRRIIMQFIGYVTAGTQLSTKIGVNMEDVNAAHDPDRKFGIEACDSVGTARNWDFVSASGSIRDVVALPEAVSQTSERGINLQHKPGLHVRFTVNGGSATFNPNNVSASGAGSGSRNVSMGIKTNNTVEKFMYCRLVQLIGGSHGGTPSTLWWNLADP